MSEDLARQNSENLPVSAVGVGIAGGALYGAAFRGVSNFRIAYWLNHKLGKHCAQAHELVRRCEAKAAALSRSLSGEDAKRVRDSVEHAKWAVGIRYTEQAFREWVMAWTAEHPMDGLLGASEWFLRSAFEQLFRVAADLEATDDPQRCHAGRDLRATIIRLGRTTVDLDLTPRHGLNIHRQDRRRMLVGALLLAMVPLLLAAWGYVDFKLGERQSQRPSASIGQSAEPAVQPARSHRAKSRHEQTNGLTPEEHK